MASSVRVTISLARSPPLRGQEAQETPEFGDRMLERGPAEPRARSAEERLHLSRRHGSEARGGVIIGQVGEELARGAAMVPDGLGRQAPQAAEGGRIGVDTHIGRGGRLRNPHGQVAAELEEARQAPHRPGYLRITPPVPAPARVETRVGESAGVVLEIPVDPDNRPQEMPPTVPSIAPLQEPGFVGGGERAQHGQGEEALACLGEEIGEHRPLLVIRVPPVAQRPMLM